MDAGVDDHPAARLLWPADPAVGPDALGLAPVDQRPDGADPPERAGVEKPLRRLVRCDEARVLGHREPEAAVACEVDQLATLLCLDRERLLDEHVLSASSASRTTG